MVVVNEQNLNDKNLQVKPSRKKVLRPDSEEKGQTS